MMSLYRIFTLILYAFIHPIGREKAALGRELWKGRMGLIPEVGPRHVWLHAASVGEVRVISHLVSFLKKERPAIKIHITTVTPAGYRTALELFDADITLSYFPLDVPSVVKKTLDSIEPGVIAFAETEIWPNLIVEAAARKIPMVLVNGRMSSKAFRRYRLVRASLGKLLGCYDRFFFKTDEDAQRYRYFLGAGEKAGEPVGEVGGDMKFDAPLNEKSAEQVKSIRDKLGVTPDRFLLVAGSTRPGEEAALARLFKKLASADERFSLLLAPRHLERVEEIGVPGSGQPPSADSGEQDGIASRSLCGGRSGLCGRDAGEPRRSQRPRTGLGGYAGSFRSIPEQCKGSGGLHYFQRFRGNG